MSNDKFWFSLILPDEEKSRPDDGHGDDDARPGETASRGKRRKGDQPADPDAVHDTVSSDSTQ